MTCSLFGGGGCLVACFCGPKSVTCGGATVGCCRQPADPGRLLFPAKPLGRSLLSPAHAAPIFRSCRLLCQVRLRIKELSKWARCCAGCLPCARGVGYRPAFRSRGSGVSMVRSGQGVVCLTSLVGVRLWGLSSADGGIWMGCGPFGAPLCGVRRLPRLLSRASSRRSTDARDIRAVVSSWGWVFEARCCAERPSPHGAERSRRGLRGGLVLRRKGGVG